MRKTKRNSWTLTGEIQPITFKDLATRSQALKFRAKTPNHIRTLNSSKNTQTNNNNKTDVNFPYLCQAQTDNMMTKFSSIEVEPKGRYDTTEQKTFQRSRVKSVAKTINLAQIANDDFKSGSSFKKKIKDIFSKEKNLSLQKDEEYQTIYRREICQFQQLYQSLGSILSKIKENLQGVETSISQYLNYIQTNKLSFIDDFIQGKQRKVQKVIRQSRLQESLSVAYLFLQMAQNRIDDHQSYLTNFLGYCLSNVLLVTRIYMLKEKRDKINLEPFEFAVKEIQTGSFGHPIYTLEEATFRMQHNNQIIVMMHKKLGRFNSKFQSCIQLFFKEADRKKTSCVQCTHYIFQYLALHIHEAQLFGISKCLQIAPAPYCSPPTKQYTLIFEPLGVVFYEGKYRPYLFQFLQWAIKYFEIIMWTWEMPYEPQIEKIIQRIQPYLTTKLYRYHCNYIDDIWVKDLQRLGRPLERALIVDYDKRIFSKQPLNGIQMRWSSKGIQKERGLLYLCQILREMISTDSLVEDTIKVYAEEFYSLRGM